MRGPLCPPEVPLSRSRAQRFDELVLDAVEQLERSWHHELEQVEFAVEDVPPVPATMPGEVPLGRSFPGRGGLPARIVVYRRPVEARAAENADRAVLVHDVVVEQVADLLGLTPEQVDPGYGDDEEG